MVRFLSGVDDVELPARIGEPDRAVGAGDSPVAQAALRSIFDIGGVTGTQTIVVLETFLERPVSVLDRTEP
ncbi:hypothetical protein [Micromonospora sp. NPDC005413]|uniref:hypothetical protein n=1 Tax=Micromonospora sp. NPDC005413 TaxID=3154563 RepID=UPI0033B86B59